jgi:hypothetical protein
LPSHLACRIIPGIVGSRRFILPLPGFAVNFFLVLIMAAGITGSASAGYHRVSETSQRVLTMAQQYEILHGGSTLTVRHEVNPPPQRVPRRPQPETNPRLQVTGLPTLPDAPPAYAPNGIINLEQNGRTVILDEAFEEGIRPEWGGTPSGFTTGFDDHGSFLRLNGDAANGGVSWLSIPSHTAYGSWEFSVMLDFATSNNNRSYVHLFSDRENPREGSGYALRIGESGSTKHFRLVRFDEGREAGVITTGERLIEAGVWYTVRAERSVGGIWQIHTAPGRGSIPLPDGLPGFDQTHRESGWFVFEAIYTATRADRFYWTDMRIAKEPEFVIDAGRAGPDRVRIQFSSSRLAGITDPGSYQLFRDQDDALLPENIHRTAPAVVDLVFAEPLAGGPATIRFSGISDSYGLPLVRPDADLLLYDEPGEGSVVINEYLYDDTGGIPQFVEIYNPGPGWYNLRRWELRDRGSTVRVITETDRTLAPGKFIVLTPDAQALQAQFGSGAWLRMDRFPSFNRASSDQIRLIAPDGTTIDSLEYLPAALDAQGRSIERRSPLAGTTYPVNWGVSEHPERATPGHPNSIGPPEEPARLVEIRSVDHQTLLLRFDRPIDGQTLRTETLQISPFLPVNSVSVEGNTGMQNWRAHLGSSMQNATAYELEFPRGTGFGPATDIFGMPLKPGPYAFLYYTISEASFRDVVINEILYRPAEGVVPRFVEIINRSDRNIDMAGWTVGRSSSFAHLPEQPALIMRPGDILVAAAGPGIPGFLAETVPVSDNRLIVLNLPSYSRFGDAVYLRDKQGRLIDSLFYQPAWGGDADGRSLERLDPDAASNDPVNWRSHPYGHSAGSVNESYTPDLLPPDVLKARLLPGGDALIRFSEFLDTGAAPVIRLAGGIQLDILEFSEWNADHIRVALPSGITESETRLEVQNAVDVAGNRSPVLFIPVAHPPQPGDLVINEIMYQPLQNRYGVFADQSQYVEILNRSGRTLSLDGIHLHDLRDKHGQVRSVEPSGRTTAWLPPGGYGVIHADTASEFTNTALARFFGLNPGQALLQARRSTLNLTSGGRELYLATADGEVLDSVTYHPDWHNPNLIDVRGISLERIHPAGPSDDGRNWSSSVHPSGGTPGLPNSIMQNPDQADNGHALELSPNPFSPDGDGFEDHLLISYRLGSPNYLATVKIYDRYGRLVRRLADRERAGFEGHFIWDGLNDNGITGRVGIYIVLFDAYDPESGSRRQMKQTAVLAKKL